MKTTPFIKAAYAELATARNFREWSECCDPINERQTRQSLRSIGLFHLGQAGSERALALSVANVNRLPQQLATD